MAASIPASAIVNVVPNVLSAGGSALDLVGLILTTNTQLPYGQVYRFSSADDVASYFGALSTEAGLAAVYFAGYSNSTIKPASLLFSLYANVPLASYVRGGSMAGVSLATLQMLTGTLSVTVNGTVKTSSAISLATASSFSAAAAIINAAFTAPGFTVSYDAVSGAFVLTNATSGNVSTLTVSTGSLATGLNLTTATGAVVSPGTDLTTPAYALDLVVSQTQDFVSFTTAWKPSASDMLAFASWTNTHADRYLYAMWDTDTAALNNGDTSSVGSQITIANYSGTAPIYAPINQGKAAAFLMGAIASIDFQATNGRITTAFKSGSLSVDVSNRLLASNLEANGYNYYGAYATANQPFAFFYPGQISGKFTWIDSWINQVWLNNGFQLALMDLLTGIGSVPYNADGYAQIEQALSGQIEAAVSFGAIRVGVPLSAVQAVEINTAAGLKVSDVIEQRGWYIKVGNASPTVRAARGSPPVMVWYSDGSSIQRITVASVLVQ